MTIIILNIEQNFQLPVADMQINVIAFTVYIYIYIYIFVIIFFMRSTLFEYLYT